MIKNGRFIHLPKFCLNDKCGYELAKAGPYSTVSFRTDGYCSARCKRYDKFRQMKQVELSLLNEQNDDDLSD